MQSFTIRDIENLTGIKAHTLRIWEQRYKFFQPQRRESQHRFYDNEDLKKLLRVAFLYHNGWKISKLAALNEQEVIQQVAQAKVAPGNYSLLVAKLIEAALEFNEYYFLEVLQSIIKDIGFENTITSVCYPYLKKVGLLWTTNNIIPAQEHFTSYIIQKKIIAETELLPYKAGDPDIILFCPQQEFHELPLLFIQYCLKKYGWKSIYLGANVHENDLKSLQDISSITHVYMHLITNFTGIDADSYAERICRLFKDKKVIASGNGFRQVQRNFVNLRVLKSDADIYNFLQKRI